MATCSRKHILEVNPPPIHLSSYLTGGLKKLYHHLKSECLNIPVYEPGQFTNEHGHFQLTGSCIMASRYRIIDVISTSGQSAVLLRSEDMFKEDEVVVIKVLHITFSHLGIQETHCLQQLRSVDPEDISHTLRLLNVFTFDGHYCMVFEALYPDPINKVFQKIPREKLLPNIRKVALRLLSILGFLQRENVIHADLKPDNILLKKKDDLGSLKVIDFGNAIHHVHKEVSLYYEDFEVQTPLYRAPEVIFGIPFGLEIDIWSVGCILAELYAGKPLFFGTEETSILKQMTEILGLLPTQIFQRGKFYHKLKSYTGNSPQNNVCEILMKHLECRDYKFCSFLAGCLQYNPDKRLKSNEAALHSFLAPELPVGFLMDLQKENTYPSVYVSNYSHGPYISSDIKRSQPSSRDLLRIGTSIIETDTNDSDTSSSYSTVCPVAKVVPFNNKTVGQKNQINLENGNSGRRVVLADTDSHQKQNRQRQSQENVQSSRNRSGNSMEDGNLGIMLPGMNTQKNVVHNYQRNSNLALAVDGTDKYQLKNKQGSMNQESNLIRTYSRENMQNCSYNDEIKTNFQCNTGSMSSRSENCEHQQNISSSALREYFQTSKHEFKKENTPQNQHSITLHRLKALNKNSPRLVTNKSSEQHCHKEGCDQENFLNTDNVKYKEDKDNVKYKENTDIIKYKENTNNVEISKQIQSQAKSQSNIMKKRLSGEINYFKTHTANVYTDKTKSGDQRYRLKQDTQFPQTKPNKDGLGLAFSPVQTLHQSGYTRQYDMESSSNSENEDVVVEKDREAHLTEQSYIFQVSNDVLEENENQSSEFERSTNKTARNGEPYLTEVPSRLRKPSLSDDLELKDTYVFKKHLNVDSRGFNHVDQKFKSKKQFKTLLPGQNSVEACVDSFDEMGNTDKNNYEFKVRKRDSYGLDTPPESEITNEHIISHEKSSSKKRSLNCINRMNKKRRKFLTKTPNSEEPCMVASEHRNDHGQHFDMYYSDGYESGPEQVKRLSDQTNVKHSSKIRSSKTNRISSIKKTKTNTNPITSPSDQIHSKISKSNSDTSKRDRLDKRQLTCISSSDNFNAAENQLHASHRRKNQINQTYIVRQNYIDIALSNVDVQTNSVERNQLKGRIKCNSVSPGVKKQKLLHSNHDTNLNENQWQVERGSKMFKPASVSKRKKQFDFDVTSPIDDKPPKTHSVSKRILEIASPVVNKQESTMHRPSSITNRKEILDITLPAMDKQSSLFNRNSKQADNFPEKEFSKSDNSKIKDVSSVGNKNLLDYKTCQKARKKLPFSGALKQRKSKPLISRDRTQKKIKGSVVSNFHKNVKGSVLSKGKLKTDCGVPKDAYEFELTPDRKIALINSQKRFQKKFSKTKTIDSGSEECFNNKVDGSHGSLFVTQTSTSFDLNMTVDNTLMDNRQLTYSSSGKMYKNIKDKGSLDVANDRKVMKKTQIKSPLLAKNEMNNMFTNSGVSNIMSPPSSTKRLVSTTLHNQLEKEYSQPKLEKSTFSEARSASSHEKSINTKQERIPSKLFTKRFSPSPHRKANMFLIKNTNQGHANPVSRDIIRSPIDDHVSLIMSEDEFCNMCSDQDDNSDEEVMLLTL